MSQANKKPCIQKRIRLWISNLRFEDKVFLRVVCGVIFFCCYIIIFLPLIWYQFLTEFIAGVLGIFMGFSLNRYARAGEKDRISKQIINSLLVELNNDLDLVKQFKSEIDISREILGFFNLFQVSAWTMFSSRLELDAIELLYGLGATYHKLGLFNEAVKGEATGFALKTFLIKNPNFLEELENELEEIIKALESLRV